MAADKPGGKAAEALRAARERVGELRGLLVEASPAALDQCSRVLEGALAAARAASPPAPGGGSENGPVVEEAALLRVSLRRAARLLQSAAAYHAGWTALLGAMTGGYTASGAPAVPGRGGRLSLQG